MSRPTAYHQLGRFIVAFQHFEGAVNDLLELLSGGDCEATRILANDLEYGKRLNTADVLFARFVDIRTNTEPASKAEFHKVMVELRELGERRNDMVHSRYHRWIDVDGNEGLLRRNSKLRGKAGEREESEEELQPDAFDADLERLARAAEQLERFRLRVIDWLYPGLEAPPNRSFDTDAQVRSLPSVAPGLCAGQVRRWASQSRYRYYAGESPNA